MKRTLAVGIFVAVAAVGCGSEESTPANSSGSSASSTPTATVASDEQQIRDLIAEEETVMAAFDFDKMAELTCTKYREDVRKLADTMFPPISEAGTPEELAAKPADMLATALKEKYPAASDDSINQLVDALIRYDEPAYKAANLDVIRQTTTVSIDKVENISITGDTATADITSTWKSGSGQPTTETESNAFLKEDGQWKDCQLPS